MQHVDHVSFGPDPSVSAVLVEESVVAVLAFCYVPLVEVLEHYHKAHFVAELDEFFCRHVVGGADRVAAHILQDGELAADGRLVDCCSKGTEVVMEADSAELPVLSVEEEALVRADLDGSETEACGHFVLKILAVSNADGRPLHIPVCVD